MAYLTEKSTVQTEEQQLITIEFAPKLDPEETEYTYQQPLFVFGERVIPRSYLGSSNSPSTICAMELIEFKTSSGQLLNQPYWNYKVKNRQESIWLNETALVRYSSTCSQCSH